MLRFCEVSPAADRPLCSCAALWIVFQARPQLVLFLLLLVIFCYPVLQRIMLLRHRHLTLNSFIASINFAWFTSVAPCLHLALILYLSLHYLTCTLWLSMKTLSHAGRVIRRNTTQVKGCCLILRTFHHSAQFSARFLWDCTRLVVFLGFSSFFRIRKEWD